MKISHISSHVYVLYVLQCIIYIYIVKNWLNIGVKHIFGFSMILPTKNGNQTGVVDWLIDFVGKIQIRNWQVFTPKKYWCPDNPNPSTNSRTDASEKREKKHEENWISDAYVPAGPAILFITIITITIIRTNKAPTFVVWWWAEVAAYARSFSFLPSRTAGGFTKEYTELKMDGNRQAAWYTFKSLYTSAPVVFFMLHSRQDSASKARFLIHLY